MLSSRAMLIGRYYLWRKPGGERRPMMGRGVRALVGGRLCFGESLRLP